MRLDNISDITNVASRTNFSIFELPQETNFSEIFEKSYHVTTDTDKNVISIENIRNISELCNNKQSENMFIVVENAEKMTSNAANAFLKALEEPREKVHFVFLTKNASAILPTIKSRANNYYIADKSKINEPPTVDEKILALTKEYVTAAPKDLPQIVDKIIKFNKDDARGTAIATVECGITLMYKSYLIQGNKQFLLKLQKLISAQEALAQNGHVKLQLIANML